jgi:putative ABC transport system permease protein
MGLILANLICFACHFKSIINIVCASNFFPCDSDSIVFLVISIHNLAFSYNEKSSIVFPDWKVDDRNPALIMGESGSGKTTLLQLMGGLLPVQKGSLVVDQIELASLRSRKLKAYRADTLEWYGAKIEQGSVFKKVNEVVLGAKVAEKLGMTLKDGFHSSHGFSSENADSHEHFHFKVSGILSKTHTVADELIFCEIPAIWKVHDEHNESLTDTVEYVKYDLLPGIRVPAASDREITSLLIKYRSPRGALQIPRYVNANTNMQSASPAFELARIQNILGTSSKAIQYLAIAIVVIAILSIAFNMYNAMQQRQYDLAVMYSIGAGFRSLYAVLVIEGMILALSGFVTGLLFTHLAIAYLAGEVEALSMLNTWKFIDMEFYTAIFSLFVGALSAFIPTLKIRRQNTATILASG